VALQGCAGCLILCKDLAAMQVQLEVLPAVFCCMGYGITPAPPTLHAPNESPQHVEVLIYIQATGLVCDLLCQGS
jgi:hypothetical protein